MDAVSDCTGRALVGASIGVLEMTRKARVEGVSLFTGAGSRFAKALAPGLITGGLLTQAQLDALVARAKEPAPVAEYDVRVAIYNDDGSLRV